MRCFNCGKDVKQYDGKRHKLYCDDKCRMAYNRRKAKSEQALLHTKAGVLPPPIEITPEQMLSEQQHGHESRSQAQASAEPVKQDKDIKNEAK